MGGERDERGAVVHQRCERRADAIPFEHREFRRVQRACARDCGRHASARRSASPRRRAASSSRIRARCAAIGRARSAVRPDEVGREARADGSRCRARPAARPDRPRRSPWRRTSGEPRLAIARARQKPGRRAAWRSRVQNGGRGGRTQEAPALAAGSRPITAGLCRRNRYKARRQQPSRRLNRRASVAREAARANFIRTRP